MEESLNIMILLSLIFFRCALKRRIARRKLRKRRSVWCREWLIRRGSGRDQEHLILKELLFEDIKSFQNYTRMEQLTFFKLLRKVEHLIVKEDTILRQSIPAATRLLLTLRFLASGQTYRDLSYCFRVSVPAISAIIPETLQAIYSALKDDYLKIPTNEMQWKEVAKGFETNWNFPHCLGALDGKHIAFKAKREDDSFYYNYKGFNSIILMALVDANYSFLYVDVGCNGRVNDAGVYAQSSLCKGISENLFNFPEEEAVQGSEIKLPYVIVGDDAFRLTPRILKPYSQRQGTPERVFNYRLSRARRVVENAFGIMASKFHILQRNINLDVEKVELITLTTCVLHNYIRAEDGLKYIGNCDKEDTNSMEINPGTWRNEVFISKLEKPKGNRCGESGIEIRNRFRSYFNTGGFVPWQWEAVKKFNF